MTAGRKWARGLWPKDRSRRRAAVWLIALLLAVVVAGALMAPGVAWAQDGDSGDEGEEDINLSGNYATCWRTDVGNDGFGDYRGGREPFRQELEALGIEDPHLRYRPNFLSRAALLDQRFYAMGSFTSSSENFDRRLEDDDDYTAWSRYEDDRETDHGDPRFDAVSVRWVDNTNTGGGYQYDPVAALRQQVAGEAAVAANTRLTTSGYRVQTSNPTFSQVSGTISGNTVCDPQTGQCQVVIEGETFTEAVRVSDGETTVERAVQPGGEMIDGAWRESEVTSTAIVQDPNVQLGDQGVWFVPQQDPGVYGAGTGSELRLDEYPNTEQDRIRVVIDLDGERRKDQWVNYTVNDVSVSEEQLVSLFGHGHVLVDVAAEGVTNYRQSRLLTSDDHSVSDEIYAPGVELVPGGDGLSVVRWPVYLTDVSWYLFEVEDGGFTKDNSLENDDSKELVEGELLPFGGDEESLMLKGDYLVKQGVAVPEDRVQGEHGFSGNQSFQFDIVEGQKFNEFGADQSESELYRRMGIPEVNAGPAVTKWKNRPLDPNKPYLLVLAFYEGKLGDPMETREHTVVRRSQVGRGGRHSNWVDEGVMLTVGKVPMYQYRRVVCRVLVYPLGVMPGQSWWSKVIDGVGSSIKSLKDTVVGLVASIQAWVEGWFRRQVLGFGNSVSAAACEGASVMDSVVGTLPPEDDLTISVSEAADLEARNECAQRTMPVMPVCDAVGEVVLGDRCRPLPMLRVGLLPNQIETRILEPASDHWVRLESVLRAADRSLASLWEEYRRPENLERLYPTAADLGVVETEIVEYDSGGRAVGPMWRPIWEGAPAVLARVEMGWNTSALPDSVQGYRVYVKPDDLLTGDGGVAGERSFFLSRYYTYYDELGSGSRRTQGVTRSVMFGDLRSPIAGMDVTDDNGSLPGQAELASAVETEWPLIDGLEYRLSVAPYVGFPGTRSYQEGPRSEPLVLTGGQETVCYDPDFVAGEPDEESTREIYDYYDCSGFHERVWDNHLSVILAGGGGLVENAWRMVGTDVCSGIVKSTPALLTWANPGVQLAWSLNYAIITSVIVLLALWKAIRMTIEHHTESSGGVLSVGYTLRTYLPRVLLAIILATLSMVICSTVLLMSSSLTCWVSEATGLTLWGFLGNALGSMFSAWWEVSSSNAGLALAAGPLHAVPILTAILVMLILFIFLVVLFCLVLWQMVLRIALLAVLVAMSPLAMILYASEQTAQWTQTWLRLFMGAAVQQTVVVMVIFVGLALVDVVGDDTARGQSGWGFVIMSFVMGLLTLYLAYKIPSLINPAGARMFDGFASMLKMTVQAAAVVTGALVGGAVGGAGGAMAGAKMGGNIVPNGPTPSSSSSPEGGAPGGQPPSGGSPGAGGGSGGSGGPAGAGQGWSGSVRDVDSDLGSPSGGGSDASQGPNRGGTGPSAGSGPVVDGDQSGSGGTRVVAVPRDGAGGGGSRWGRIFSGMLQGIRMAQRGNRAFDQMTSGDWVSQRTRLDVRSWDRDDLSDVSNRRAQDEERKRRSQEEDSS